MRCVVLLCALLGSADAIRAAASLRGTASVRPRVAPMQIRCQEAEADSSSAEEAPPVPEGFCAQCGCELFPNCNGEGRVVGGLTAIDVMGTKPFEWWPIKVRCCNSMADVLMPTDRCLCAHRALPGVPAMPDRC